MSETGRSGNDQPRLTVGSLLGLPLGTAGEPQEQGQRQAQLSAANETASATGRPDAAMETSITPTLTTEEQPWSLANGALNPRWQGPRYRPDGVEAITYTNVFDQSLEQVWFDGKVVYALDVGEVDVDADRVKVAQDYQVVYAVDMDERLKKRAEPERAVGQLNIYDSVPGMDKYSPIWQFNYVIVPRDYSANTLRSEADCLNSGYQVIRSNDFEN